MSIEDEYLKSIETRTLACSAKILELINNRDTLDKKEETLTRYAISFDSSFGIGLCDYLSGMSIPEKEEFFIELSKSGITLASFPMTATPFLDFVKTIKLSFDIDV